SAELTGTATSNTSSSRSAPRSPGFSDEPYFSRYFPDCRVVSASRADRRKSILETVDFRKKYPATPHAGSLLD
ncbi:hypothetical protein, partial [Burkholderia pseudomallei]|uniref:hypothetical protein n=1 Tax=Burkholderia pseudomallei TaxID=28450 RepID=UPI001C838763